MCVSVCPQRLSELYYDIHRSYLKVTEVVNSEKRLFGRYYRVAFYGQVSDISFLLHTVHTYMGVYVDNQLWLLISATAETLQLTDTLYQCSPI